MSFGNKLHDFAKKTGRKLDDVARDVVINIGKSVVEMSPVGDPDLWATKPPPGYVGGRFRANWQHGFGSTASGTLNEIDASGGVSLANIQSGVDSNPAAGVHFISNNLPYAQRLENGYSSQAPAGMVGLTVIKFKDIVNISVQKVKS